MEQGIGWMKAIAPSSTNLACPGLPGHLYLRFARVGIKHMRLEICDWIDLSTSLR